MIGWADLGNSENLYEKELQCMNSRHSSHLKRSNWFFCVCVTEFVPGVRL